MKILVTGAAGFIGSHLVEYHLNKGDTVYGIDDLSSGIELNLKDFLENPNFSFVKDDILTAKEFPDLVSWAERIYNMAAIVGVYKVIQEPTRVLEVNIGSTELLFKALCKANHKAQVLLASSAEVYGPSNKLPLSEDDNIIIEMAARNRLHYALSKLTNESMGLAYYQKFDIPTVMARLFNTIGPRQLGRYGMVVPNFVGQAKSKQPITVFGSGEQTRSFCDVRDIVVMLDLLMSNPKALGEVVNVGNNKEITINQLANLVKNTINPEAAIQHKSYLEAYGENYIDIQRRQPDISKLFQFIDYKHKYTIIDSIKAIAGIYN